ncbi:MAG: glucose-1-phosphate adenylyltransferase [Acidobacteria bacterium]|nr:glucose-1-phosphate adenylyltransferase [Acidobacteriota bacterium]
MPEFRQYVSKTLTFIMAGGHGTRLHPLTEERAKPAVTFGGIYRLIDFTLSNCYHSGLRRIIVLTQYRSRSLHRHIFDGWNFINTRPGEYIDLNPPQFRGREGWYLGTADAIYQNLFVIRDEKPEYVLVLGGDHIYKMHYGKFLKYHIEKQADISVACIEVPKSEATEFGVLHIDEHGRVINFIEKPVDPPTIPGKPGRCLVSMGIYYFTTDKLISVLNIDMEQNGKHDFGKNIIPYMIDEKMSVYAFPFADADENRKPESYWRDVGDLDAYYLANLELASVDPPFNLYDNYWPIMTWYPPLPPAKTVFSDEDTPVKRVGKALDSLLSPGCIVSGGEVVRSILSPRVKINSYSTVKNSILLTGVSIGRKARIQNTIIDKEVQVPAGYEIGYNIETDRKKFTVSDGGIVVVPKGFTDF